MPLSFTGIIPAKTPLLQATLPRGVELLVVGDVDIGDVDIGEAPACSTLELGMRHVGQWSEVNVVGASYLSAC
jgi:hypothetical protein